MASFSMYYFFSFWSFFTPSLNTSTVRFWREEIGLNGLMFSLWVASLAFGQPLVNCPGSSAHPLSNHLWLPGGCSFSRCHGRGPLTLKSSHLINVPSATYTTRKKRIKLKSIVVLDLCLGSWC